MPHRVENYLLDALTAARSIADLTRDKDWEAYASNEMLRWAVERQFITVGEAFYQIQTRFPEIAKEIPNARKIVNFRHILVHGYGSIEDAVVWGIIEQDLRILISDLQRRLE